MDENAARRAGCDAILRKPFEASVMLDTLAPASREGPAGPQNTVDAQPRPCAADDIRAAVEHAVELELPRFLDELTQKVLSALGHYVYAR